MDITSVKLVYFSPTGTTGRVVQGIAEGIGAGPVDRVDITTPPGRQTPLTMGPDALLVVAVPVYMGRVPALVLDWLASMRLDGTPAVCVVVYGNRVYDDALLELRDMVAGCGGIPIAGAAFVGEHSFSSTEFPTAHGRPDADDVASAVVFGRTVWEKVQGIADLAPDMAVQVPGESPYRGSNVLWNVDFIVVNDACIQCGTCADLCPAGAIDAVDSAVIDTEACITCCACVKQCPQQARIMMPGPVLDAQKRLHTLFSAPKQPEVFV